MSSLEASSSSALSGATVDGQASRSRKFDEEHTFAMDNASDSSRSASPSQSILNAPRTLKERMLVRSRSRFPLLYHYTTKVVTYVRGPRPKVDLPGLCFSLRVFRREAEIIGS